MASREAWQLIFSEEGSIRRLWTWRWQPVSRFYKENRVVELSFALAVPESRVENAEQLGDSPTDTRFFP